MNEQNIIGKIVNDYYDLTRIVMGSNESYEYLITLSFSISNMIRVLDKESGDELLIHIAEEIDAYEKMLKITQISKGDDPFDAASYKADFISGINNDLKISLCKIIGDVLSENDIF